MFPPEAIGFLKALKKNNDREWFQARKDVFETKVKAPMVALVEAINKGLLAFAPDHINDPKKAVYRIYRDTRFSNDKTPYKTHIAAIFPRRGLERHSSAGYYVQISPEGVGLAAGAYMPGPEELLAFRTWLVSHHQQFLKESRKAEKLFGPLQGASLARSPKGFDPAHAAIELIRKKAWFYWTETGVKLATSPALAQEVLKYFKAAAPVVELINAPLAKKARSTSMLSL
jgi:uncharacterized protein (TIGR02453 family)